VRIEREPITDANRGAAESGPAISEEEHEVVLHGEVPVVDKDVEAVERIRLNKETVTEQQTVTDQVRKERVDLDEDGTTNR
jgi:stress response protein YsnF